MMLQNGNKKFRNIIAGEKGFTLAELVVSAGILGVVITGIMVSYIRCMELNEVSQNKSLAVKAARSRMELIRMTPYATLVATYNNVAFNVTGFNGRGVSYVTVVDAKNLRLRVSVSWQQKNNRVFGEDANLNGVLNGGEDKNGDGFLSSPVDITEVMFDRT